MRPAEITVYNVVRFLNNIARGRIYVNIPAFLGIFGQKAYIPGKRQFFNLFLSFLIYFDRQPVEFDINFFVGKGWYRENTLR